MTSSLASTSAVSSASQFSAETLLSMLERPSTSLSQPVEVIPETQNYSRDFEVIIPGEDPTVTSRPFVRLCDPAAVALPLHFTPLEPSSILMKYLLFWNSNTFHRFLVILLSHLFFHHSSYQPLIQHHNNNLPHLHIVWNFTTLPISCSWSQVQARESSPDRARRSTIELHH